MQIKGIRNPNSSHIVIMVIARGMEIFRIGRSLKQLVLWVTESGCDMLEGVNDGCM